MSSIEVLSDNSEVLSVLNELLERVGDLSEPMESIAAVMESATERAFDTESDPATGEAWESLTDSTKARRGNKWPGQILQVSGGLASSIETEFDSLSAIIGTNLVYAPTHQFGAARGEFGSTVRGSPIPWGDIPARPFLGISEDDEQDILDILEQFLAKPL